MADKSKSKGNFWILIIIITFIVFLLGWYFLIYVPGHEEQITERNFRELNQVSQNLSTRANSLITNARNVVKDDGETLIDSVTKVVKDSVMTILFCGEEKGSAEALLRAESLLNYKIALFNNKISFREISLDSSIAAHDQDKIELHINTPQPTTILYSDRIPFTELSKKGTVSCISEDNGAGDNVSIEAVHLAYKIEIEAPDLIGDLLHFTVFENYILATEKWPIYESNPSGSLVFEKFTDTLSENSQNNLSQVKNISVNGVEYDAYIRPIHISKNQTWNLVGFVRSDRIWSESLSISPKLSLFIVVVSLFVILAMPLIKLHLINNREKVNTWDVLSAYFSIVSLTSITAILIFSFYIFNLNEVNLEQNLKTIRNGIDSSFTSELGEITTFLNDMDRVHENLDDITSTLNPLEVSSDKEKGHTFFKKYPYIEDYFVIDSSGYQDKKWTVRKNRTPKFNVASRDYVNRLHNETGYELEGNTQMFLQSIVSYNTGQELSVITKKSDIGKYIVGLTSRLYSLYDTVLPYGYQFVVFDANGRVHFHSQSDKNLNENFFEEVTDSEAIRQRINANNLEYASIFYRGRKSAVNFSKFGEGLPYYMAVIGDKGIQYGIFSRVLRTTISVTLLLLLLFFGGLYLRARFRNKLSSYSRLLRPISKDRELRYSMHWYVVFALCIIIPIFIFFFSYDRETFTLNRLTEKKTAELLVDKQLKTKEYIAWLGEDLPTENYNYLKCIHTGRNSKGNFLFQIDTTSFFNINMPGHTVYIAINDFDHEMNNTFQAYKAATLFSGITNYSDQLSTGSISGVVNNRILKVVLTIALIIFLLLLWGGAFWGFKFVKRKLFEVRIQPKENWLCSKYEKLEKNKKKLFLVNVSKEKFINEKTLDWKQIVDQESPFESLKGEIVDNRVRIVRFPSSGNKITKNDVDLLFTIAKSKIDITLVSKQSPAILIQEIKEEHKSKFQEALAEFETYYWQLTFSKADLRELRRKPLKTHIEFKKLFDNLNKNEQYLLYDLAEDGILNTKNNKIINILSKKGIIVANEQSNNKKEESVLTGFYFFDNDEKWIHMKNDQEEEETYARPTFRQFVLENFDKEWIEKVKEEADSMSRWAKLRTPLLLIFGGLFVFILLTQQQIAQEIIGILTTLGLVIGSVSKITSMVSSKRKGGAAETTGMPESGG